MVMIRSQIRERYGFSDVVNIQRGDLVAHAVFYGPRSSRFCGKFIRVNVGFLHEEFDHLKNALRLNGTIVFRHDRKGLSKNRSIYTSNGFYASNSERGYPEFRKAGIYVNEEIVPFFELEGLESFVQDVERMMNEMPK